VKSDPEIRLDRYAKQVKSDPEIRLDKFVQQIREPMHPNTRMLSSWDHPISLSKMSVCDFGS
jgi:hypothetical protein